MMKYLDSSEAMYRCCQWYCWSVYNILGVHGHQRHSWHDTTIMWWWCCRW